MLKLFGLTKEGRGLCHQHDIGPLSEPTEGGVEHRYWINHVDTALRSADWRTQREYAVSTDVIVDIHAEKGNHKMAVLVETGQSNVKRNIARTVNAGYNEIWVVSNNPKVLTAVERGRSESSRSVDILFKHPNEI